MSIFKKRHGEKTDNPSIKIYVNKTENRITFRIKKGYYLELLTNETIKLLGSTENKITKNKNGEYVPHLEITEVILVLCNVINNDLYTRVLYTFVSNIPFGSLLEISPTYFVFLKTSNSEFSCIDVWLTDQNSQLLEIDGRNNLTLLIK